MHNDEYYMQKVIAKSRSLIFQGDSPFAAALLIDNDFYISGNMSKTKRNPNMHAEIVCINEFCDKHDYRLLRGSTMFCNCEPCLMCLHSIINVGISRIVFGATINDVLKYESEDVLINTSDYIKKMNLNIILCEGVLKEEAVNVFKECISYGSDL